MFNIKQKIHEKKQGGGTSNMLSELDLTHQTVNVLDDKRRANRNVGEQPSLSPQPQLAPKAESIGTNSEE